MRIASTRIAPTRFMSTWIASTRIAPLLVAAAVAVTYANTFGNGWHYDDLHAITENQNIRSLENPLRFFTDAAQFSRDADKAMFRPLLLFTFALNYAWSGLETWSYHAVNIALQAGGAILVWLLLRGLGHGPGAALLGGLLFGLHPLGTEPVNYISSRSELLMAFWVLAAVVLHQRAGAAGPVAGVPARAASVACFGLGLLTKSVAITTPALIVLHDVVTGGGWRRLQPLRYVPYAVVAALYLIPIGSHLDRAVVSEPVRGMTDQLLTQTKAVAYYAKLLVFPIGLNVHHQFFEAGLPVVIVPAALLAISFAGLALRGGGRALLGLGWIGLCLAPTAVVPLHVLVNDHRLYLPVVGVVLIVVALVPAVQRHGRRAGIVAALVVLALASATMARNRVWLDEYTLWSDAEAKSPHPLVPTAHIHLGNYAKDHGAYDVAIEKYERALEISPGHVAARTNLGLVYEALGDVDRAIDNYRALLADDPQVDEAWHNLGNSLRLKAANLRQGRDPEAASEWFELAREAYSNVSEDSYHYQLALNNIGTVHEVRGRPDSAAAYYRRALAVSRYTEHARENLERLLRELPAHAQRLLESGRDEVVEALCLELLEAQPDHRTALFFLAVSRFQQGRYADSLGPNERLVQVHADFEMGYLQLANLYETLGEPQAAAEIYRRQVQRFPAGELTEEARQRLRRLQRGSGP